MLHSVMHEEEQESVTESWTNVCDLCQQLLDESRLHCCPHFLSVWSTWVHYHSKDSRGMWEEYQIPQSFLKKERPYLSCLVQLYEEVLYVITKFWALKVTDFIFQVDELKSRNFQNFYFSLCRNCFAFSLFTVFCWWRCPGWLSRSGYANTLDNIFFLQNPSFILVFVSNEPYFPLTFSWAIKLQAFWTNLQSSPCTWPFSGEFMCLFVCWST